MKKKKKIFNYKSLIPRIIYIYIYVGPKDLGVPAHFE